MKSFLPVDFSSKIFEITLFSFQNRPSLMAKLEKEKELMRVLAKNLEEEKQKYADFNRERGLRARTDDKEDLLECILPGSELHSLLEMERNLDQVM